MLEGPWSSSLQAVQRLENVQTASKVQEAGVRASVFRKHGP